MKLKIKLILNVLIVVGFIILIKKFSPPPLNWITISLISWIGGVVFMNTLFTSENLESSDNHSKAKEDKNG